MRTHILLGLAVLCLGAGVLRADEASTLAELRKQRRLIDKQLASPNLNDRVAGLGELKKYPVLESVRIALPFWSKDPSPAVRVTAAETLFAFRDETALRPALRADLKKEITDANSILLAVWLAGANPEERRELMEPLGKLIDKRQPTVYALFGITDWLGTQKDPAAVKVLSAFSELNAFPRQFAFRRCVVTALIGVRHVDAITRLVELLTDADGETRGDIIQYLAKISNLNLGNDTAVWQEWWSGKKAAFKFPDDEGEAKKLALQKGTAEYYGIPIYAKKVMFILDTSGSMKGQRIVSAKKELVKTLENLPNGTSFNLVSFNSEFEVWQKALVVAGTDIRTKATRWVNQLDVEGATFTYDALKATMDLQPEAIYLLTDGQPTGGTFVEPDKIIEAVRQMNKYRRITIHVIGVNPGPEDGPFSQFMKKLAAENWGQYRRVD